MAKNQADFELFQELLAVDCDQIRLLGSQVAPILVAEKDRMIAPATQDFMAARIGARIHSRDTDHSPLASAPESVVSVIVEAADALV